LPWNPCAPRSQGGGRGEQGDGHSLSDAQLLLSSEQDSSEQDVGGEHALRSLAGFISSCFCFGILFVGTKKRVFRKMQKKRRRVFLVFFCPVAVFVGRLDSYGVETKTSPVF